MCLVCTLRCKISVKSVINAFEATIYRQLTYSLKFIPPSVAYMRQWIRLALVQIMACRLFGAKPSSEPLLGYCQLDPKQQNSVIFFHQNTKLFIHVKTSANIVCEKAAIYPGADEYFRWDDIDVVLTVHRAPNAESMIEVVYHFCIWLMSRWVPIHISN